MKRQIFFTQGEEGCYADYEVIDNCLVIKLKRDLDHHCAQFVKERSDQLIDKRHIRHIIFDFERTTFMDSSGIGVIMGRYKRVSVSGGRIAITHLNTAVDRIFRLSGLFKIVKLYSDNQSAMEDFKTLK